MMRIIKILMIIGGLLAPITIACMDPNKMWKASELLSEMKTEKKAFSEVINNSKQESPNDIVQKKIDIILQRYKDLGLISKDASRPCYLVSDTERWLMHSEAHAIGSQIRLHQNVCDQESEELDAVIGHELAHTINWSLFPHNLEPSLSLVLHIGGYCWLNKLGKKNDAVGPVLSIGKRILLAGQSLTALSLMMGGYAYVEKATNRKSKRN